MNDDNKYLVVGGFAIAVIVGAIAMVLILADDSSAERLDRYMIPFEQNVNGLSIGAPVTYLGVRVGSVISIKLANDSNREVDVLVEVYESTPISNATYATLTPQGVTGVTIIGLSADVELEATPLDPANTIDGLLVIPSRRGGIAALLSSGGEISTQLSLVLHRMNELLSDDNIESVSGTLTSLALLTDELAARRQALAGIPNELKSTLAEFRGAVANLNGVLSDASPKVPAILSSLQDVSENLAEVSDRLNTLTADSEGELATFLEGGLGQTPSLMSETRIVLRDLQKLLRELRDDPSLVIYKPNTNDVEAPE
ncbi:MAG: MlaD family protein [Pseudomonadota bacterium]